MYLCLKLNMILRRYSRLLDSMNLHRKEQSMYRLSEIDQLP